MNASGLVVWVITLALDIQMAIPIIVEKPHKMISKEIEMTQVQVPEKPQQVETPQQGLSGPEVCDACGVRAIIGCFMPFGTLYFCNHHYNKHAMALESSGAVISELSPKTGN
jgi:hypothetical protein